MLERILTYYVLEHFSLFLIWLLLPPFIIWAYRKHASVGMLLLILHTLATSIILAVGLVFIDPELTREGVWPLIPACFTITVLTYLPLLLSPARNKVLQTMFLIWILFSLGIGLFMPTPMYHLNLVALLLLLLLGVDKSYSWLISYWALGFVVYLIHLCEQLYGAPLTINEMFALAFTITFLLELVLFEGYRFGRLSLSLTNGVITVLFVIFNVFHPSAFFLDAEYLHWSLQISPILAGGVVYLYLRQRNEFLAATIMGTILLWLLFLAIPWLPLGDQAITIKALMFLLLYGALLSPWFYSSIPAPFSAQVAKRSAIVTMLGLLTIFLLGQNSDTLKVF